ncbi:hypothetical protein M0R45_036658 [Rubus argutus]|uniref:Flotillin-like n=1 Tax=Rubus argutus TaxID=59490 RepID=A0AAW1W1V4_RUBAR
MLCNHVKELVQVIIEGETHVLEASMTMEEVFKGIKEFKQEVFEKDMSILVTWGRRQAANHSKVDIAEARMKGHGEVGSKIREGKTLQNAAKIDVETKIISMQRQGEGKKEELKVKTEVKVYENQREAENEAEAQKANAEEQYYAHQKVADGEFYAKQKEDKGLVTLGQAQGVYVRTLLDSLGGNYSSMRYCLIINSGMYQEIAKINAEAWQCGYERGCWSLQHAAAVDHDCFNEQTGTIPPKWLDTLTDNPQSGN